MTCPLEKIGIDMNVMMADINDENHTLSEMAAMDVTRFRRLKQLSLYTTPTYFAQHLITLASSTKTMCWPQLTSLDLDADIDDRQTLKLKNATTLTDATLDAIVTYLPNITELGFKYSKHLTAKGVHRLVHGCDALTVVALKGCRIKVTPFLVALGNDYVERMQDYSMGYDHLYYLHTLDQQALDRMRRLDLHALDDEQVMTDGDDDSVQDTVSDVM
ncbi:unnamed protein product [Absidia cylindrospora]